MRKFACWSAWWKTTAPCWAAIRARLSRANKRFHKQIHLASHNRFLVQQLDLVHRSMALMANTSFAAEGRDEVALDEHAQIVVCDFGARWRCRLSALKTHISRAFETRLRVEAGEIRMR